MAVRHQLTDFMTAILIKNVSYAYHILTTACCNRWHTSHTQHTREERERDFFCEKNHKGFIECIVVSNITLLLSLSYITYSSKRLLPPIYVTVQYASRERKKNEAR